MVRMTESQFALFQSGRKKPSGPRKPPIRRRKEDLPENIVVGQIRGFLESRGWTVTRQQSGLFKQRWGKKKPANPDKPEPEGMVRVGEKGVSDYRAEKPVGNKLHYLLYFETKAPGKTPSPEQLMWLERRRATGTPADWFDCFDVGRRPFIAWFRSNYDPAMPLTAAEQQQRQRAAEFE